LLIFIRGVSLLVGAVDIIGHAIQGVDVLGGHIDDGGDAAGVILRAEGGRANAQALAGKIADQLDKDPGFDQVLYAMSLMLASSYS
jgi:hypothetical protein